MELIFYEWRKLGQKKLFWALSAVLLVVNLLMIYTGEQYTSAFFYAHEQGDSYQAWLTGDESADTQGYYTADWEAQNSYIQSYAAFIDEMEERAAQMSQSSLYQNEASYVSRNLVKTCHDFAKFQGMTLTADNAFGLRGIAGYGNGILFVLVFLGLTAWFVLFSERDKNLLLLLKGTQRGHCPLAAAKLTVLLSGAALYTTLQELLAILFYGWLYGYGSLERPLQSVSLFRNCAYSLTVGEGLAAMLVIRVATAVVLACVVFAVGMIFKNEMEAVLVTGATLGTEYLLYQFPSASGALGGLKCVNPFYCWNMEQMLGNYLNLNLMGHAVGKDVCAGVAALLLVVLLSALGILAFHRSCQIRAQSRLEPLMQRLREYTGALSRRTSLLYYELYKMMIQQKKGVVLVLLAAWCIYSCVGVFETNYYSTADEAAYHYYISVLKGPVTEDTFAYLEEEDARLQELWEKLFSTTDEFATMVIQSELDSYEGGFYLVQQQAETLAELPGDITEKYLLDERAYESLWSDSGKDVALWFAGAVLQLFFLCSIYTVDERRQMLGLLRTTKCGRRPLERSKCQCAALCTLSVFLALELPLLVEYWHIDGFSTAAQRMCDFTSFSCTSSLPLWSLILAIFLLKGISFFLVGAVGLWLSKVLKRELVTVLVGSGVAGAVALLLYRFGWSIDTLLLQLF